MANEYVAIDSVAIVTYSHQKALTLSATLAGYTMLYLKHFPSAVAVSLGLLLAGLLSGFGYSLWSLAGLCIAGGMIVLFFIDETKRQKRYKAEKQQANDAYAASKGYKNWHAFKKSDAYRKLYKRKES